MACTYYGGTTAQFVRNVLQGFLSGNAVDSTDVFHLIAEQKNPPSIRVVLFADGGQVLSSSFAGTSPLFIAMDEPKGKDPVVFRSRVNLEFLASCKLLDMQAYYAALEVNPSPVAMRKAIEASKGSTKPDYPRTRTHGIDLADFIEDLLYSELIPLSNPDFEESFEVGKMPIMTKYIGQNSKSLKPEALELILIHQQHYDDFPQKARLPAFMFSALNLKYLEQLGFLDLDVFHTAAMLTPRIEALQFAVRAKLGYHGQIPKDEVALPTDFMMDL